MPRPSVWLSSTLPRLLIHSLQQRNTGRKMELLHRDRKTEITGRKQTSSFHSHLPGGHWVKSPFVYV